MKSAKDRLDDCNKETKRLNNFSSLKSLMDVCSTNTVIVITLNISASGSRNEWSPIVPNRRLLWVERGTRKCGSCTDKRIGSCPFHFTFSFSFSCSVSCMLAILSTLYQTLVPHTNSTQHNRAMVGRTPDYHFDKSIPFFLDCSGPKLTAAKHLRLQELLTALISKPYFLQHSKQLSIKHF